MFRLEDLSESIREPFVGIVVHAEFPCDCEVCQRGEQKLQEMGRETRGARRIHIAIKPLERYDKFQHTWYTESKLLWSGFGAFVLALNKLGFVPTGNTPEEQWNSVKKYLLCNIFQWESINAVDYIIKNTGKVPPKLPEGIKGAREIWIPVKKLSSKEVELAFGVVDRIELCNKAKKEYEAEGVSEEYVDELMKSSTDRIKEILEV